MDMISGYDPLISVVITIMVANIDNMKEVFVKCNRLFFDGKLPVPGFELAHTFKICANFSYCYGASGNDFSDPIIKFSDYYDFPEKVFVDVMCHEMVHYYLAFYGIDRKVEHGKDFRKMANSLNKKYRLHIVVEYDRSMMMQSAKVPLLKSWLYNLFNC